MIVTLEPHELYAATQAGATRAFLSKERKSRETLKRVVTWRDNLEGHVRGSIGEVGVAKALGLFCGFPIDTFKSQPDLRKGNLWIEVRTRDNPTKDLIVRKGDKDTAAFVLAYWNGADKVELVGWIVGRHAKKPEHLADYGGLGEAYFISQQNLLPISELVALTKNERLLETIVND